MSKDYKVLYDSGKKTKKIPSLHPDDSIDTLKRKIITVLSKEIAYDEIYLFIRQLKSFTPEKVFLELSQNGRVDVTRERLNHFLLNYVEPAIFFDKLKDKDFYDISDLYEIGINNPHVIRVAVGQRFLGNKSIPYPFIVDPFVITEDTEIDTFLRENAKNMISTQNGSLIMQLGDIEDNNFYLLTAKDLFIHSKEKLFANISGIYFPFLEKKGIDNLVKYESDREKLLETNKKILSPNVVKGFENIDLFYNLFKSHKYPVAEEGIKEIDFVMNQPITMIIPLEQLFKILHSTKHVPFVKLNPGFRRENLLRLFSENKTFNGKKIPYLPKAMILKLIKQIGKNGSISFFIEDELVCSLQEDGSIRVMGSMNSLLTIDEIEEKVRLLINPILTEVQKYVRQSGFHYELFKHLRNDTIEVIGIEYKSKMTISSKIMLKPYMSCISSVFNVIQEKIGKEHGIKMRYKRVSNYSTMNAIDAFISEVINKGFQRSSVIEKLEDNFNFTKDEAEEKFIAFINEAEVEQGIFQNRKIKVRDNPGFPTSIQLEKFTSNVIVTISDINSIDYLSVLPIYISSFMEIVQGKSKDIVASECSRKVVTETMAPEIVAPGEKPFGENKEGKITVGKELVFDDEIDDDMLDMLMGSDYEEDEDEEMVGGNSLQSGGDDEGGADAAEELRDITGMSLSNPNYFSKRMEERDPSLFLKKNTGKFNAYSKMCPSNIRRQPVILTPEEKERIDREHPGSYSHSIKYGSDPKNPFYYICPRYWCIPENTSLTDKEVDAGDCGGRDAIIPYSAKKVPSGKTIYEFGADQSKPGAHAYKEFYDENGEYITHHPGFIPGDRHPDGHCMPCCFKRWDAKEQVRRRQQCSQDESEEKVKLPKKRQQTDTQRDYIKGEEKFPLDPDRWGYLPIELQLYFNEVGKENQISALNPILKDDAETLLRQGVEPNKTQSFIACIADVYSDYSNEDMRIRIDKQITQLQKQLKKVRKNKKLSDKEAEEERLVREIHKSKAKPTIKKMKKIIENMLTLDNYTNYQNGNLVNEFYPGETSPEVSIDDYQDTQLYKKLDTTNEDEIDYFIRLIQSFENFKSFLQNDDIVIDYQYLWDIICMPNPNLFPNGINMVIFEIPEDDATANVELICPTNHYSSFNYSGDKLKLLLVKKNNYFEPIYLYNNLTKKVKRMFRESDVTREGKSNIANALRQIRMYLSQKCRPLNSLPKIYTFEQNIPLDNILIALNKKNYLKKILAIAVNFNGKAIGIHIENSNGKKGYVPCLPSNYEVTKDINIEFLDESKHWTTYERTVAFLQETHQKTKLLCSPSCKVVEDGMIIGLLTKTNQMVPLKKPEEMRDDDIDVCTISSGNEKTDKIIQTDKGKDTERIRFVNAINNEKEYYTAFRNLARIELNLYKNIERKNKLLLLIEDEDRDSLESYTHTLHKMIVIFKEIMEHIVSFSKTNYNIDDHSYPSINLLNGKDNRTGYYLRLADEALRYQRIKMYLFEKNKYLSFTETQYKINENEILIPESMISNEYFEGMKAFKRNKYVHFNTYDTAQPLISVSYSDKVSIDSCIVETKPFISKFLQTLYSDKYKCMVFGQTKRIDRTPSCSFDLIITILKNEGIEVTKQDIQNLLLDQYKKYPESNIISILSNESKKLMLRTVKGQMQSLEHVIISDHYYLTFLDLWMIATVYDLPMIFFGQYRMRVNNKKTFANKFKVKKNEYYQIHTYAPEPNIIPRYKLVVSPNGNMKFDIKPFMSKRFHSAFPLNGKIITIGEYIKKYNV